MARPKTSSKKVPITLPMNALATLDQLVAGKFYGESRSEIARYLLVKALDAVDERRLKGPSRKVRRRSR
jgi:metal-responsive CopG/Arc/MetJ family transcriptional regulator